MPSKHLSPIQFSPESVEKGKKRMNARNTHPSMSNAQVVYGQLTDDYPKESLGWVDKVKWSGPKEVPLDRVDWDDEQVWKAAHEPSRVNIFVKRIKELEKKGDHVKPAILINRPVKKGEAPDMIPDGHHRALAYRKLEKSIWAWEGKVTRKSGPWDKLHDSQYKDDGRKNIYR